MKLRATINNEKETKELGGNKSLVACFSIELENGQHETIATLELKNQSDAYRLFFIDGHGNISPIPVFEKKKSNRQIERELEEDVCIQCGKSQPENWHGYCAECDYQN